MQKLPLFQNPLRAAIGSCVKDCYFMTSIAKVFSCLSSAPRSLRVIPGVLCLLSLPVLNGCMSRSLTGLTIQPSTGNTTVIPGVSAQFKAIGTYTESGHATVTQDITTQVTWSTVIPAVATIDSSGLA